MQSQSRVASTARGLGIAALAAAALGILGIQIRLLPAMAGFYAFGLGLLLGLIALIAGLVGLYTTRSSSGLGGRRRALIGLGIGLGFVLAVLSTRSADFPPINDITTDIDEPPEFRNRQLSYPGESFSVAQKEAYPDLTPIHVEAAPPAAFDQAVGAAESLGWDITHWDQSGGILEATDTTAIFRFIDDVVVRVRADGAGSRIDMRSKSRDGRGDIGANAARIRAFRTALGQ